MNTDEVIRWQSVKLQHGILRNGIPPPPPSSLIIPSALALAASDLKNGFDDVGLLFLLAARNILLLRGRRLIRGLLARWAHLHRRGAYSNPVCSILPQVFGDRRAEWLNAINNEGCRPPHQPQSPHHCCREPWNGFQYQTKLLRTPTRHVKQNP